MSAEWRAILTAAIGTVLLAGAATGEVIYTVDGKEWNGKIVAEDERTVTIEVYGNRLVIPRKQIERIELSPEEELVKQAAKLTYDDGEAHYQLGLWCEQKGLARQAREFLLRTIQIDPGHVEARRRLGYERIDGEWMTRADAKALRDARKAAAMKQRGLVKFGKRWVTPQQRDAAKQSARRHLYEALLCMQAGTERDALKWAERALEQDAELALAHLFQSYVHFDMDDLRRGLKAAEAALEVDEECAGAHNNIAYVQWQRRRREKAFDGFEKAMELDPVEGRYFRNFVSAHARMQIKTQGAMRILRSTLVAMRRRDRSIAELAKEKGLVQHGRRWVTPNEKVRIEDRNAATRKELETRRKRLKQIQTEVDSLSLHIRRAGTEGPGVAQLRGRIHELNAERVAVEQEVKSVLRDKPLDEGETPEPFYIAGAQIPAAKPHPKLAEVVITCRGKTLRLSPGTIQAVGAARLMCPDGGQPLDLKLELIDGGVRASMGNRSYTITKSGQYAFPSMRDRSKVIRADFELVPR